jgi:GNAT superfamily N-acetyltransferase
MPPSPSDLAIEPVAPDDEPVLREWFQLVRAARDADHPTDPPPCWADHRGLLSHPWPGEPARGWLTRAGGDVVGAATLALPQLDNTGSALAEILVAPAHRRRGVGRLLLAQLVDEARAAGRGRLIGEARSPLEGRSAGQAFAEAAGAHEALTDVRRRLHLPADAGAWAGLAADAAAASRGYELVQWTDVTPDAWVDDIARLTARMSTDAPLGDLHWEPERYDAARMRAREAVFAARGRGMTVTAAHGPDGRLVAFTELGTEASVDRHAHTWNTLVQPEHRGHRLGMRVKLANLALLRERFPATRTVDTYNAASNRHMIAINEAIGFRALDRMSEYERDL